MLRAQVLFSAFALSFPATLLSLSARLPCQLGESCLLHLSLLSSDLHVLSHFCVVCYLAREELRTAVSRSAKCISMDHHVLLSSVFHLSEAMIVVICCLLSALPTMRNFDKCRDHV